MFFQTFVGEVFINNNNLFSIHKGKLTIKVKVRNFIFINFFIVTLKFFGGSSFVVLCVSKFYEEI